VKMVVYMMARTVAWLYGYAWPPEEATKCLLVALSFVSLPVEIVAAGIAVHGLAKFCMTRICRKA